MKKRLIILLAACMLLLAACAGLAASDEPVPLAEAAPEEPEKPEATAYEAPEYEVVPFTTGNHVEAEDGTVLADFNYQTLRLALHNEEAVSPEDAETAARNIEAFNEKMQSVTEELMEQGEDLAGYLREAFDSMGAPAAAYADDAETSAVFTGDVISVCLRRYSYTGGAHPNSYVFGYLFDLASGQFILDPGQLADDPGAFRAGAAELLIEKAEACEVAAGYWDDYQEIIRSGSSGVTLFDETGMEVIYARYELGPYVIGEVELHLDWEELEPLLGPGGMARLGMGNAE